MLKCFFEFQYRFGKPRWDTNVTPPEVVEMVEGGTISKGRALDLGCGTGTNALYLARAGFDVVGVDFSPKAIASARAKARRENIAIDFQVGDVTRLDSLRDPFQFILDIGCFHSVELSRRSNYAAEIARLTQPGAWFMLYAFAPRRFLFRTTGARPELVQEIFAEKFSLERIKEGTDRGEFSSAWYWWKRK